MIFGLNKLLICCLLLVSKVHCKKKSWELKSLRQPASADFLVFSTYFCWRFLSFHNFMLYRMLKNLLKLVALNFLSFLNILFLLFIFLQCCKKSKVERT